MRGARILRWVAFSLWLLAWAGGEGVPGWASALGASPAERKRDADSQAFFDGPIRAWELTIPPESMQQLRDNPRDYAPATVRIDGRDLGRVGVHVKGSAGSKRSVDDRPALSLKFNRYLKGHRYAGLEKVHLNNSVQDSTLMNEILAGRLYRAAGIPTTRATHAFLRFNGRDLGVYVVKEAFDEEFVRRGFPQDGDRPGNLYEGGFLNDIQRELQLDVAGVVKERADLRQLRAAVAEPLSRRWAALTNVLDTERFLTLAAIQMTLDDWDGYLRNRNNYRLYFPRTDGRAIFLPSGMDQLLVHPDAPVRDAWMGSVANGMFELPDQRLRLRARMRELSQTLLTERWLTNESGQVHARLAAAVAQRPEAERPGLLPDYWTHASRVRQRLQAVGRELAAWPDPLPSWPAGKSITPTGWNVLVQTGRARAETNASLPGFARVLHVAVEAPQTRASFRTVVTLPAGSFRVTGWVRTVGLNPLKDEFGQGAAVRVTGATAQQHVEGDQDWREVAYEFEQSDDGPVELIVEARAEAGEVWFDPERIRVVAR